LSVAGVSSQVLHEKPHSDSHIPDLRARNRSAGNNGVAATAKPGAEPARLKVAQVPLSFESNQGQTDSAVKFFSRGDGYALFLTPTEAVFKLRHAAPAG
jgi:hypothetical protein